MTASVGITDSDAKDKSCWPCEFKERLEQLIQAITCIEDRVIEANPPLILEQLRQIMQTSDTDVDRHAATQVRGSAQQRFNSI